MTTTETLTLIVYELIPENTKLFLVPNSEITAKQREWLKESHNKFANCDDYTDALQFLNAAINKEGADEGFESFQGCFLPYEQGKDDPITNVQITSVYLTGFVL